MGLTDRFRFAARGDQARGAVRHWLVIEIIDALVRIAVVSTDSAPAHLTIHQVMISPVPQAPASALIQTIAQLLEKIDCPVGTQVLVLVDERRGAVIHLPITLRRTDPQVRMGAAELDNGIGRVLWQAFDEARERVAPTMGITASRVQLSSADVIEIKLDGHQVVDPVGFPAKEIRCLCRVTLVDKVFEAQLHQLFATDTPPRLSETSGLLISMIVRQHPSQSFLFAKAGTLATQLYIVEQGVARYLDSFGWGTSRLLESVTQQFATGETATRSLLATFERGEMSPALRRTFEALVAGELAILGNGIMMQNQKRPLPVFLYSATALPAKIIDHDFMYQLHWPFTLTLVNEEWIRQCAQYDVEYLSRGAADPNHSFTAMTAALFDAQRLPCTAQIGSITARRVRWLRSGGR